MLPLGRAYDFEKNFWEPGSLVCIVCPCGLVESGPPTPGVAEEADFSASRVFASGTRPVLRLRTKITGDEPPNSRAGVGQGNKIAGVAVRIMNGPKS